jgi:hypothetical protein
MLICGCDWVLVNLLMCWVGYLSKWISCGHSVPSGVKENRSTVNFIFNSVNFRALFALCSRYSVTITLPVDMKMQNLMCGIGPNSSRYPLAYNLWSQYSNLQTIGKSVWLVFTRRIENVLPGLSTLLTCSFTSNAFVYFPPTMSEATSPPVERLFYDIEVSWWWFGK